MTIPCLPELATTVFWLPGGVLWFAIGAVYRFTLGDALLVDDDMALGTDAVVVRALITFGAVFSFETVTGFAHLVDTKKADLTIAVVHAGGYGRKEVLSVDFVIAASSQAQGCQ